MTAKKSSTTKKPAKRKRAHSKEDQARFERQIAELKAALQKLPADRQEQFKRELEEGKEH